MAASGGSAKVVYVALAGNLAITLTKFAAAFFSGSSSMLSEAIHSTVDTGNELLLLYGMRQSKKPVGSGNPFGNGRELYFWAFIVALMVFAMGAAVSAYQGVRHILAPEASTNHLMAYGVLALSFVFEFISWRVALKNLRAANPGLPVMQAARRSKDPTTFTVLLEDSAALLGLILAFIFILIAQTTGDPRWDGVDSLCIALVLAATSIFLARESKSLLIGERALPEVEDRLRGIIASVPEVQGVNGIRTLQLGPDQVLLAASVDFRDDLTVHGVEGAVSRIEKLVKAADPSVQNVLIRPVEGKAPA